MRHGKMTALACLVLALALGVGTALAESPTVETMSEEDVMARLSEWGTPVMFHGVMLQGYSLESAGHETGGDTDRYFFTYTSEAGDTYTVYIALMDETGEPLKTLMESDDTALDNGLVYCTAPDAAAEGKATLYAAGDTSVAARRDGTAQGIMVVYEITSDTADHLTLVKALETFGNG